MKVKLESMQNEQNWMNYWCAGSTMQYLLEAPSNSCTLQEQIIL